MTDIVFFLLFLVILAFNLNFLLFFAKEFLIEKKKQILKKKIVKKILSPCLDYLNKS